jgi:dipeptidyl-peptidase-4
MAMKKLGLLIMLIAFSIVTYAYSPVFVSLQDGKNYARLSDDKSLLLTGDYKTGHEDTLLVFSTMRNVPLKKVEAFRFSPDYTRMLLRAADKDYYVYQFANNRCDKLSLKGSQAMPIFSPDGSMVAFERNNNLFIKRLLYDTEVQVTTDGSENTHNGVLSVQSAKAFGISHQITWSKDSKMLVYNKDNQVYMYHVHYKWNKRIALPDGENVHITQIKWSYKDDTFAVMYLNDIQKKLSVALVNAGTLVAKRVYTYEDSRFIAPDIASTILFFPENDNFAILSDKDGYIHAYVYTPSGILKRQVGKGNFDVTKIYGYDAKTKRVFYQSSENGPLNRGVYAIDVNTGKKTAIAAHNGTNDAMFSANFSYFVITYSSIDQPFIYAVCDSKGNAIREISRDTVNPGIVKEAYTFADGLKGWILRKPGVTQAPVIFNVTDAQNQWKQDVSYRLAEQGYVVATVAAKGNIGFGENYRKAVYGNVFKVPALDYIAAAKSLIKAGIADAKNLFIMGNRLASGVVFAAMMQPDSPFAGGVVISPVTDLLNYNPVEVQRYMNKDGVTNGYQTNQAVGNAKNIKGKLLMVHAMNDGDNPLENTNKLVEELVNNNVQFEMQLYPNRDESFTASLLQPHLFNRILNFIKGNIK